MDSRPKILNDVAILPPEHDLDLALDDVGLENVQMQVRWEGQMLPARGQAGVSLVDRQSRGIHMSRIFKSLTQFSECDLSWEWMAKTVDEMLVSHAKLSDRAHFEVSFDLPVLRRGLISDQPGWRTYPVRFQCTNIKGRHQFKLGLHVLYSSTCPCSASLSRQALQEKFSRSFGDRPLDRQAVLDWLGESSSIAAVPHSQRSEALCEFLWEDPAPRLQVLEMIDSIEGTLGTAVQAAVKREDEQEFARLNADNLMFCEDAARKLKAAFLKNSDLADFRIEVRHFESLHPHDVVARAGKNDLI
jgi:GTP cyclohydrolase I